MVNTDNLTLSDTDPVTIWNDVSGNANNATAEVGEQPLFVSSSSMNTMPALRFDGSNDHMVVADADILDGTSGITYFAVIRPNNLNNSPRGILGKRITFGNNTNYAYTWFFWTNRYLNLDINTANNRFNTNPTQFSNATNYILSMNFDGTLPTTQRSKIYSDGSLVKQANETSTSISNSDRDLTLGALNDNYGTYLGADYAEVIHYNYSLNTAERAIVNNYLSAKFNITIDASIDFYNEDDDANGNFDFNVAGIGQASDGSNHTDSQGTGIVRIKTPTNLENDEYLIWGEDTKNADYNFSVVAPENKKYRLNTKWRVSETGDVGGVAFSVNQSDLDFTGAPSGIVKLIRSTTSDFSTIDEEYELTLSGGVYSGTVDFNNNDYFTLEIVFIDLELTKTVNTSLPKVGEVVVFTINLTNQGSQNATGVIVRDKLPASLTYNAVSSNISVGTYDEVSGNWDLTSETINSGQTVSIQIAATINAAGKITNTAEVISANQADVDSTPNNGE